MLTNYDIESREPWALQSVMTAPVWCHIPLSTSDQLKLRGQTFIIRTDSRVSLHWGDSSFVLCLLLYFDCNDCNSISDYINSCLTAKISPNCLENLYLWSNSFAKNNTMSILIIMNCSWLRSICAICFNPLSVGSIYSRCQCYYFIISLQQDWPIRHSRVWLQYQDLNIQHPTSDLRGNSQNKTLHGRQDSGSAPILFRLLPIGVTL